MALNERVYEWATACPPWQQELFLRVLSGAEPPDADLDAILELIVGRTSTITPRTVTRGDLPTDLNHGTSVGLLSIKHHGGVNRLGANEELLLIGQGLNVVYGPNGSGKSGWARIPKHAGRAHTTEPVLGDVYLDAAQRPVPRAAIRWQLEGDERLTMLDLTDDAPADLAGMHVFDAAGGIQLLTADHQIDYVPHSLSALQRLRSAQARIAGRIDERIAELQRRHLDPTLFPPGTKVRELVEQLTSSTDINAVRTLASLSAGEQERIAALTRQVAEIDSNNSEALIRRCERDAQQIEALAEAVRRAATPFSSDAAAAARTERDQLAAAQEAAAAMSASQFSAEPLSGVGSGPWSVLWGAARQFVAEEHHDELPSTHDPAYCPLCMQTLSDEAKHRLERFDAFVRSDVEERLTKSQAAIAHRLQALPVVSQLRQAHAPALGLLYDHQELQRSVVDWLEKLNGAANAMRAALTDRQEPIPVVDVPPTGRLKQLALRLRGQADEHRRLQDPDAEAAIRRELVELQARLTLEQHRESVEARISELVEIDRLRLARQATSGQSVSLKIRSLTQEFITGDLERALREHLSRLNFDYLEVIGCKTSGREGNPRVGLIVRTKDNVAIRKVLSDGEQRRLALAFFLAEVSVAAPGQPVVLDDPVCSVDHLGRRHIARTLVDIAKDRQVIVFTHELAFLHELQKAIENAQVPLAIQHVTRIDGRSGRVQPDLPWAGKTAEKRRGALRDQLSRLEAKHRAPGSDGEYEALAAEFCRQLRTAFERAIEDRVIGGVITRGDPGVHPQQLKDVAWSETICALADQGLAETSPWVHDSSRALDPAPPTPDELREGLQVLSDLIDATKTVIKARKDAVDAGALVPGQPTVAPQAAKAS